MNGPVLPPHGSGRVKKGRCLIRDSFKVQFINVSYAILNLVFYLARIVLFNLYALGQTRGIAIDAASHRIFFGGQEGCVV